MVYVQSGRESDDESTDKNATQTKLALTLPAEYRVTSMPSIDFSLGDFLKLVRCCDELLNCHLHTLTALFERHAVCTSRVIS